MATLSAAALLCMVALVGHFLWQSHARAVEAAELNTRNLAEAVGSRVSAEFKLLDSLLQHAAHDLPQHERNAAGMISRDTAWARNIQALALALPTTHQLFVFDARGSMLYSSGDKPPFSIADRIHFQRLRDDPGAEIMFSRLHKTRPEGRWGLAQLRALRDAEGRFMGVVSAVLYLDGLSSVFGGIDVGSGGLTLLRSTQDSRLVLRVPRLNEQDFDQPLPPTNPIRQRIDAGARAGSVTYMADTDGVRRMASFRRLDEFPFYVQVAVAEEQYLAAWRQQAAVSAALALLVMAVFGLVTMRLAKAGAQADRALKKLQTSEQRLCEAQEIARMGSWEFDHSQGRLQWSEEMFRILQAPAPQATADLELLLSRVHPDDLEKVRRSLDQRRLGQEKCADLEYRLCLPDGRIRHVHETWKTHFNRDGSRLRCVGTIQDITERKQAEGRLALAASVFGHAREAIVITDAQARVIDANEAFTRITGYSRAEIMGRRPEFLKSDRHEPAFFAALWNDLQHKGFWEGEIWNHGKCGREHAALTTITAVRDERQQVSHYVALFSDITAAKETEAMLRQFAHFDALTGLPNRVLLADRLGQAMAGAQRSQRPLALAYVDLDGFKAINDKCGHEAGDQVLLAVAERMQECLRAGDTIARLGGDEFVAVLTELTDEAAVLPVVERLLKTIGRGVNYEGQELQVSGSIGVTFYPQPSKIDADQLLRQADQAMYQAKLAGKNRHHVFDLRQHASLQGRYEQIERIRLGLKQQEFELHFQPKVHMRSGRVLGAEALLRWRHPQRGLVPPLEFLPLIAQHPLEIDLGWWVVDTALAQMDLWAAQGLHLPVSVNVTGFHLQQPEFLNQLRSRLERHPDLPRHGLGLEVLESSALHDIEQISGVIEQCRVLGVDVALDDFGTGYSTLTHLRRLPVQELKIDRSFVQNMLHDAGDLAILEGIIGLARAFQRDLVAEGVESVAHGEALLQLGCEVGQGYGIARPMPGADIPGWVASWRPDAAWRQAHMVMAPAACA